MNELKSLFKKTLLNYKEKTAVIFNGKQLSYGELLKGANRVARALRNEGIHPNSPVALMMSNCMEYVISFMGNIQAGAVTIPLNDRLGESEIAHIINDSGAEIAIIGPNFLNIVQNIKDQIPKLRKIIVLLPTEQCPKGFISWDDFQSGQLEDPVHVNVNSEDIALIMYTGGTTGMPKGVVHTQKNLVQNYFSHIIELNLQENEKILLTTPLPHSAGFLLTAGLLKGATIFIENKFDPIDVLSKIEREKITLTFMVPTMIYRLLDQVNNSSNKYNFDSLRTILYGAAPITPVRLKQGIEIFGQVFMQLYGQTEAPNFIMKLRKEDHQIDGRNEHRLKSCGQPVLMAELKIVDENGNEVPRGEEGEIVALTPYNMSEYYKQPEKTEETLKNGWLHTGDIGKMDEDGYVYLLDRKKDMIISGGFNVYTTEVENVIQKHPDVSQVAVIGIPHSDWGEAVMAIVVPKNGVNITEESIMKHCDALLSKYKRPKKVTFTNVLPVTPYGKVDKKVLRKPYWEGIGRGIN